MDLSHGGHLTHGSHVNFSGKFYNIVAYGVNAETGYIDYDMVRDQAKKYQPKMIIAGGSAYPRHYDFKLFREIADEVGAFLMADVAHPAGLIAAGEHPSPMPHCHVVTSTTHKTLRGPRGGLVMMGKDFENTFGIVAPKSGRTKMMSELLDSTVMPGIQGGPLMHVIAAKAVAFGEALKPSFKTYAKQVISNAKALGVALNEYGFKLISGGTDNHLLLIDLTANDISGKKAERLLEEAGMTTNKNMVPFDQRSPLVTSGIRIGTAALTTRGFKENEMKLIGGFINEVITDPNNESVIQTVRAKVKDLVKDFPHYQDVE
jgi:glycine hydroxymethyltransferase